MEYTCALHLIYGQLSCLISQVAISSSFPDPSSEDRGNKYGRSKFLVWGGTLWEDYSYHHGYLAHKYNSHLPLLWRHNGRDCVSNHQPHHCLLNRLFRRRSKKISKLRVTGLCAENSPMAGEFPAQMASNADNSSIWWRQRAVLMGTSQEICTRRPVVMFYCVLTIIDFFLGLQGNLKIVEVQASNIKE